MITFPASRVSEKCTDSREQPKGADTSNKPSQESESAAQRSLADAIERGQMGFEGLNAARPALRKLFGRIERLEEQIDQVFGGHALDVNLSPLCPANRRRFKTYLEFRWKAMGLLGGALELWMLACGLARAPIPRTPRRRRSRSR